MYLLEGSSVEAFGFVLIVSALLAEEAWGVVAAFGLERRQPQVGVITVIEHESLLETGARLLRTVLAALCSL